MFDDSAIPHGWKWLKIQDLVKYPKDDIVDGPFGSDLKASEYVDSGVPIIRLQNIDRNHFINKKIQYISHQKAEQLRRHSYRSGDIVITKLGDPVGKACVVPDDFGDGVIVADVVRVKVDNLDIDRDYLVYAINSHQVINQLTPLVKGSTRPRVNLGHIRNLLIPVPSALEQQRIVAKIEALFTQLDAGTAALKRVQAGLKRYKASVLKAAVEGRLVPQDPSDESAAEMLRRLGKKPLEGEDLPPLPQGWCWVTVDDLAKSIQYGYTVSASDEQIGPKFLRITDIQHGLVEWETVPYCKIDDEQAEKYLLRKGDIVFARTGATTGKSYLINECPKSVFASYLIRLRLYELLDVDYFSLFLDSPLYWSQIMIVRKGSAQPGVNATILATLKVPYPPLDEQRRIVSEVERRLSVAKENETVIETTLVRVARLRQAILKQAFEGKLT